jgi:hypothetical protein
MSAINNPLSSNYLETLLSNALQNAGGVNSPTTNQTSNAAAASIGQQQDSGQLSPLAQLLSTLQQLQQSNPTEYAQVTGQISANLQTAAQTAQTDGNTAAANQLTTLANDFSTASTTGQLPNIQDLAQAIGGAHHHHHHHHASSDSDSSTDSTSSTDATTGSTGASSTDASLSQFLASLNATGASGGNGGNGGQNGSLNPATIIANTLAAAGISNSNS